MRIIYGTNTWSHHQLPVATELSKLLGPDEFRLAIFEEMSPERRQMGWGDHEDLHWAIGPPRDALETKQLFQACLDADVMVFGDCPWEVIKARIATGKLTLLASERILKKPSHQLRMINPRYARGIRRYCSLVNNPHVHALTVGYYASDDLRKIGAFADRVWKWGYFIEVNASLPDPSPERPIKVIWAGRMLDWKRVDLLLKALAKLKNTGCIEECRIVGDGPERKNLLNLARRLRLDTSLVRFEPFVPFYEVRTLLHDADVYVLTSNRHEGWGAIAGEAMSEGCVLVANEAAGSARDLVRDGNTGLLFRDGDVGQLSWLLKDLASDYPLRMQMRQRAWERMQNLWHPRIAAERLVALSNGLLKNDPPIFGDGPCSRSENTRMPTRC